MKRKKKERVRPMPTEEDKARARLKAASADPLVWAMKSVDEKFPDTREKDMATVEAEAAIVEPTETVEEDIVETSEIQAEGKTTMPTGEGVVTMEVTPMRQDVSGVAPEEVKRDDGDVVGVGPADGGKAANAPEDENAASVKKAQKTVKTPKNSKAREVNKPVTLVSNHKMQPMMIVGIVLLALLAIGGVSFGIVAMVRQNRVTEELENQIATAASQNEATVEGDYVTLKDWGLKIKVVTGLTNLTYNYQSDTYAEVQFWGAKQDKSANYTPDFAKQTSNSDPLGTVVRVPRYERAAAGRLIWYDDYYNYYYQGPSGVPNVSESEMSWWVESYLLIKDMLTNADNYVKVETDTIGQQ